MCRLTFSNDLKKEIAFDKTPYHYCAASGNTDLAAYLYSLGVPFDQDITVATFSADGKESRTPWNKALAISPVDTAHMAGKCLFDCYIFTLPACRFDDCLYMQATQKLQKYWNWCRPECLCIGAEHHTTCILPHSRNRQVFITRNSCCSLDLY